MSRGYSQIRMVALGCSLSVACALHVAPAGADQGQSAADGSGHRSRIGLVLAGGGAKGDQGRARAEPIARKVRTGQQARLVA